MSVYGRVAVACLFCLSTVCFAEDSPERPALLKQVAPEIKPQPTALEHLRLASEQLHAAGLKTEAAKLEELATQIRKRILKQQAELEAQAKRLRQVAGTPEQILCRCYILELSTAAAEEFEANATAVSPLQSGTAIYSDAETVLAKLKQAGKIKMLASPEIVTKPGAAATSHSGGKFPILVVAGEKQPTVEWKPFGVTFEVEPELLENGKVLLRFASETSERDFTNAVQVNDLTIPGLTVRRINTKAELNLGQTLVVKTVSTTKDQKEIATLFTVTPVAFEK